MEINKGDLVKLYEDKEPWSVFATRGKDIPGVSFKEYILREPSGHWRMTIVRIERIEKVLSL